VSASASVVGGFAELQATPLPSLTLAASVRDDSDSQFGEYATWRIAPAWTWAATGTLIKGSVGTGFKTPTLTQLYVSFPSFDFFANPLLKPETSLGYDIGFEQPLGHGLRLGATWFHNAIKNLIEESADFTTWANLGRATTYGVESFASLAVAQQLTLRADYTWLVARDDLTGLELLRRPENKASLSAVWRPRTPLTLSATVLGVGSWIDGNRDFSIERLGAPGYVTVNIAGAYDLGHGVTAFARIDNLFDAHYQEPFGFDKPGIGGFAGLKVDLGGKR
jgi:vitamin B12 transporter